MRRAPPAGAEDKSPFVAAFILMIHICFLNTASDSTRVRLIDLFRTLLRRPGRAERTDDRAEQRRRRATPRNDPITLATHRLRHVEAKKGLGDLTHPERCSLQQCSQGRRLQLETRSWRGTQFLNVLGRCGFRL